MLRLRQEGRLDLIKALDFVERVTILSCPLQRDAAFGITGVLRQLAEEALMASGGGAPASLSSSSRAPQRGGGGGDGMPEWMTAGVRGQRVALGAQRPPAGGARGGLDLGLVQLMRRLAHDETACFLVYRGNEWVGDVR